MFDFEDEDSDEDKEEMNKADNELTWVVESRQKLEARRNGTSMAELPPERPPKRLKGYGATWMPLPPYEKMAPGKWAEAVKQNLPGNWTGMTFPHCTQQLTEFGPQWFTEAFQKFGTLPKDNSITEVFEVEQLPISGFDAAGGAGIKACFKVKYANADPKLHTELFAKMPWPPFGSDEQGRCDYVELNTNVLCEHLFPYKIPQVYFCDLSPETTNWILITERVPFAKRGAIVNGKLEQIERKPFEVLPSCGKYQDYLLEDPSNIYYTIFRAMAQVAGWDNLGRFDSFLGSKQRYTTAEFLAFRGPLKPKPAKLAETKTRGAMAFLAQGIEFATQVAPQLFSDVVKKPDMLAKMQEDFTVMVRYFDDIRNFVGSNSDFVAACHFNLQSDNAFFWRDESGDMDCGVLDWAGFGRQAFVKTFMGCLRSAETSLLEEHEEGLMQAFCEEYERYGGPTIDWQELLLHHRLIYITFVMEVCQFVEREILRETPRGEWKDIQTARDDVFMSRWQTRCRGTALISAFEFWPRRDQRAIFEKWKSDAGEAFVTVFK